MMKKNSLTNLCFNGIVSFRISPSSSLMVGLHLRMNCCHQSEFGDGEKQEAVTSISVQWRQCPLYSQSVAFATKRCEISCLLLLSATLGRISVSLGVRAVQVGLMGVRCWRWIVHRRARLARSEEPLEGSSSSFGRKTRLRRFCVSYLVFSRTCSPGLGSIAIQTHRDSISEIQFVSVFLYRNTFVHQNVYSYIKYM